MTDSEYENQKARVQTYIDKWFRTLGFGWYQVDFEWSRHYEEDEHETAALTSWRWQYRQASVTFYLPAISAASDEDIEGIVVHEFAHILTGAMVQNAPEENRQLMEYGTETVARALIWARKAGEDEKQS